MLLRLVRSSLILFYAMDDLVLFLADLLENTFQIVDLCLVLLVDLFSWLLVRLFLKGNDLSMTLVRGATDFSGGVLEVTVFFVFGGDARSSLLDEFLVLIGLELGVRTLLYSNDGLLRSLDIGQRRQK